MATVEQLGLQIGDRFIHSEYKFTNRTNPKLIFIEGELVRKQGGTYLVNIYRCSLGSPLEKIYPIFDPETGIRQTVLTKNDTHFTRIPQSSHEEELPNAA